MPEPALYVDARCLQDPEYNARGIGLHASSLLRTRHGSRAEKWRAAGLIDDALPPLSPEHSALFDTTELHWNPVLRRGGTVFICLSPMTHDPAATLRFAEGGNLLSVSVVYDFIPFDRAGYLTPVSSRIGYFAKLARLKRFDLFAPISEASAGRLRELLNAAPNTIHVTGACARRELYAEAGRVEGIHHRRYAREPYVLTVGGADRRKNTEVVIRAVAQLRSRGHDSLGLTVVGDHGREYTRDLYEVAGEGAREHLTFCKDLTDHELAALYAGAVVTVAASHAEGFSLPVVEAAVCGSPVLASDIAAHLELIDLPEALFPGDEPGELARRIEAVIQDGEFRERVLRSQARLAAEYHEDAVGRRFWDPVTEEFERRKLASVSVSFGRKPKLAVLSPFPPDASGVARFTALTLESAREVFDIDLYTDAPRPLGCSEGFEDAGPVRGAPARAGGYDAVLPVLGNSHFHMAIFDFFERWGGPCILHDARLTHVYRDRLGRRGFREAAERWLGRAVTEQELDEWLLDRNPATLAVEPVVRKASPLIVHTRRAQTLLRERYGARVEWLPFPPIIPVGEPELDTASRAAGRSRVGVDAGVFLIATFGYVDHTKAAATCVIALDLLRGWGFPAELHFVGSIYHQSAELPALVREYGLERYVRTYGEFVSTDTYRDYLLAADAAVQLRTYDFGQVSAALADCIGAALPAVANEALADCCDAPGYVARAPDRFSPLLVAEALAGLREAGMDRGGLLEERRKYCREHNFRYYSARLREVLGLN